MAFPTNPTNGQQATNNGVVYTYDSTLTAWTVGTGSGANISANSINVTSSVAVGTTLTVTGATILSSTASVTGNITSSGNISGTYVLGNVAFATGIPATYGDSNVVTLLATYGSNTISTTGNVSSGNSTISRSLAVGNTTPSGTTGEIRATNAITAFYSDRRLKTEINQIENALDKIDQLTGVLYTQNKLAEQFGYTNYETQVGLYAQQVQQVQPEAVKPAPFDIDESGQSKSGEKYLTVQYEKLVPLLVEGIKELRTEIKELKGKSNANNS
jgi:trimeric autotransporter adhesin